MGDKMRPLKTSISITLDGDIIEKVRELSEKVERSLSQYINIVLREHIAELEEKKK